MQFEDYVGARHQALLRYAYLLTGDAHRAEDLVQTALVKSYAQWKRVVSRDQPDAYVRKIITNAHLDWTRRRSNSETTLALVPDRADEGRLTDPAERVAARDELRRGLAQLSPQQRAVLVLRHYEGYSDAEIADVLECTEGTIRSYSSRGLAAMRNFLEPTNPIDAGKGLS